jgi:predicted NBD/HSP70 family sugar kinase
MKTAADLGYLRGYNEALVVAIARREATFDRATVAAATGLTPQAVSKVLARLIDSGLVVAAGREIRGVGKPTTLYRIDATSRYAIGAHVGRRRVRLVLTDLAGVVRDSVIAPLPANFTPDRLLAELAAGVAALAGPPIADKLVGVGIGMVGPLDYQLGVVRDAHGLEHWHDVPLRDLAAQRLAVPVIVDKDTTAGVIAEAWRRGREFRDAALVMVETGVGAGLWLSGSAYRGAHTNAGEFGHTVIALDGPLCVCGRHGCVEVIHERAVADGDFARAARVLASGIVNLLQTVDVNHVVLAGSGISGHSEVYLSTVQDAVSGEVRRSDWLTVEVSTSALGADFAAAGAAMEVLNAFYGVPGPA